MRIIFLLPLLVLLSGWSACSVLDYPGAYRTTKFRIYVDYSQLPAAARANIQSITLIASGVAPYSTPTSFELPYDPSTTTTTLETDLGPFSADGTLYLRAAAEADIYDVASQTQSLAVTPNLGDQEVDFTLTLPPNINGCSVIQSETPLFSNLNAGDFAVAPLAGGTGTVVAYVDASSAQHVLYTAQFNSLGTLTGGPWQISSSSAGALSPDLPHLVTASSGYVVAWQQTDASASVGIGVQALNADGSPSSQAAVIIPAGTPTDARPTLASLADGTLFVGYQSQMNSANPAHVVVTQLDPTSLAPIGQTLDLSAALSESGDQSEWLALAGLGNTLQATWSTHDPAVSQDGTSAPYQLRTASLSESLSVTSQSLSVVSDTTTDARLTRMAANNAGTDAFLGFEATPAGASNESIWLSEVSSTSGIDKAGASIVDPSTVSNSSNWPNFGIGAQVNLVTFYQFLGGPGPQIQLTRFDANGARVGSGDLQISQNLVGAWGARYSDIAYLGTSMGASGVSEQFAVLWLSETAQTGETMQPSEATLMYARVSCTEDTSTILLKKSAVRKKARQ